MTTATLIARKSTYITEQAARGNVRAAMWVQSEIDLLRQQEKEIARLREELQGVVGRFLELNAIYKDTHELNQFILNHFSISKSCPTQHNSPHCPQNQKPANL